jgi:hypothetical protein
MESENKNKVIKKQYNIIYNIPIEIILSICEYVFNDSGILEIINPKKYRFRTSYRVGHVINKTTNKSIKINIRIFSNNLNKKCINGDLYDFYYHLKTCFVCGLLKKYWIKDKNKSTEKKYLNFANGYEVECCSKKCFEAGKKRKEIDVPFISFKSIIYDNKINDNMLSRNIVKKIY